MKLLKSAAALLLAAWSAMASAGNVTLSPGANLNLTIQNATNGDVITLNAGTYTPATTANCPFAGSFCLSRAVTVRGVTGNAGDVILQATNAGTTTGVAMHISGISGSVVNGAVLENVTLQGVPGGIWVRDIQSGGVVRPSDITIRNVVINGLMDPNDPNKNNGFGVQLFNTDRIVVDGVTVTSFVAPIYVQDNNDSIVMNSTVVRVGTATEAGLSVLGGSHNTIVNNVIGSPKTGPAAADSGYSFQVGAVVFDNTTANRFEGNVVQGFRSDGIDFTTANLTGVLPTSQQLAQPLDNYIGKNTVIATAAAYNASVGAFVVGGTGIWSNCGNNNAWIYGNDVTGAPEGGISNFNSNSNLILANKSWGNVEGVFITGNTTLSCPLPAYTPPNKPIANYVRSNNVIFNRDNEIIVRDSDTNDVSLNFLSPRNGRTGALQTPQDPTNGEAALTYQTSGGFSTSNGMRVVGNISSENRRGIWNDDTNHTNLEFYLNRIIGSAANRIFTTTAFNIDAGSKVGGNFWTQAHPSGNPSQTTPYTGVYTSSGNATGLVADRFPFQTEDIGRPVTVQVFEPFAATFARGTQRSVRWKAGACIYNDVTLDGTTVLAADLPNTGYAVVTIPVTASLGAHTIVVNCKNSAGGVLGQGSSPGFTLTAESLQLRAPGRDDVINTGTAFWVAWKKDPTITAVNIKYSLDGGATFTTALSNVVGTAARITIPAGVSRSNAMVRVESTAPVGPIDTTDGVFALRGTSGFAFTNVASRTFTMGTVERLEWASPQNSRVVNISANGQVIASRLPDRGYFDWVPKDIGAGAVTLSITFLQSDGLTAIGAPVTNASGTAAYATNTTPPAPTRLTGISTRGQVLTGNNVLIAGFIIGGNGAKTVVVRARGPSLGIAGSMADPIMTLVPADGSPSTFNDNWQTAGNSAALAATGLQPGDPREPALMMTLNPGAYTAIIQGQNNSTGLAIAEVYEVDAPTVPLTGISTRGFVGTGNDVMIAGFIITGSTPQTVVVRARGPSTGVPGALLDSVLTLVPADGSPATANDNWQTDPNAAALSLAGFAPGDPRESALFITLNPGAYTAIVNGSGNTTGVAIVEVFPQ